MKTFLCTITLVMLMCASVTACDAHDYCDTIRYNGHRSGAPNVWVDGALYSKGDPSLYIKRIEMVPAPCPEGRLGCLVLHYGPDTVLARKVQLWLTPEQRDILLERIDGWLEPKDSIEFRPFTGLKSRLHIKGHIIGKE